MSRAIRIVAGLVLAAVAQTIAVFLNGAGHGWTTPFFASMALWVFLPITFVMVSPFNSYPASRRNTLLALLLLGFASDVLLAITTENEGFNYIKKTLAIAPHWVFGWLAVYICWQLLVVSTLAMGPLAANEE